MKVVPGALERLRLGNPVPPGALALGCPADFSQITNHASQIRTGPGGAEPEVGGAGGGQPPRHAAVAGTFLALRPGAEELPAGECANLAGIVTRERRNRVAEEPGEPSPCTGSRAL